MLLCVFLADRERPIDGRSWMNWLWFEVKGSQSELCSRQSALFSWMISTYLFLDPDQKRKKNYKRKKKQTTNLICLEVLCRYHPHYLGTLLCMTQSLFLFSCCMFDLSWMTISSAETVAKIRGGHENWLYYSIFKYHFLELKPL